MKLGTDIVHLPRFEKTLRENKEYFRDNVFHPEEIEYAKVQRLASIFAAKEAVMKALGLEPGQWLDIKVAYRENGKPYLASFPKQGTKRAWKHELSIAHDGEYVIATALFYQ